MMEVRCEGCGGGAPLGIYFFICFCECLGYNVLEMCACVCGRCANDEILL